MTLSGIRDLAGQAFAPTDGVVPSTRPARVLARASVAFDLILMALVGWFTFYLAGARIDLGSVYTGPVGAAFGAFLLFGFVSSAGSSLCALGARWLAPKGSRERALAWAMWLVAHAFFAVGFVAASFAIHVALK
jgi:hypothetical protein